MNKVMVYGSLRRGMGNHGVIEPGQFLGFDVVEGFNMHSYGAYPYVTHGNGAVTVEVYEVDCTTMGRLDTLEGYPSFYNRELRMTKHGEAWIYFIDDEEDDFYDKVEDGDWVEYKTSRNVPAYLR